MKLATIQWKGILDILKTNGVYKAEYGRSRFTQYTAQYKHLADLCEFSNCPIFCAPIDDKTSMYGIDEDNDHIKILLDIPKTRVKEMDYYDWSNYLYYSDGQEYDEEFGFNAKQALKNIDKYITIGTARNPQYVIEEIYAKDIVK